MDVRRGPREEALQEPWRKGEPEAGALPPSENGCFDCNICLDFAADPVVTLCGHLYCWPCMHRWLQQADASADADAAAAPQRCPVCKAALMRDSLVPLYGRGGGKRDAPQDLEIPRRPSPTARRDAVEPRSPDVHLSYRPRQHYRSASWDYMSPASPLGESRVIHSTAGGVLGGMAVAVLPWVFRNQGWGRFQYLSPYYMGGNGSGPSPRVRREKEMERSLHQIWVFFCCFALLCLLLF